MTAPVPQAAVDAADDAWLTHAPEETYKVCRCGWKVPWESSVTVRPHHEHRMREVAAAVVAAVQGPIKAEALREAADEFEEFAFVDDKRFKTVNTAAVRLNAARILRARADRIEAQP